VTAGQVLGSLWRRKLIILAALVVTVAAAGAYAAVRPATFASTAVVTPSSSAGQASTTTSTVASPSAPSPKEVAAVAAAARVSPSVVATCLSTGVDATTGNLTFTCSTSDAAQAQAVANAAATVYVATSTAATQAQVTSLQNELNLIENQLQGLQLQLAKSPGSAAIQAQITATSQEYATVSSQLDALTAVTPATVSQTAGKASDTASSKSKVLVIAGLIGLVAGCGIALIVDLTDTRIRGTRDLEELLGAPVLAELPTDKGQAKRPRPLPVGDGDRTSFTEAVRELRTSLQVLVDRHACPVLVVTSPEPEDGKSFITGNLAASWALSGKRTAVVSGDLRRPKIDVLLGVTPGRDGMANLLAPRRREERSGDTPGDTPIGPPAPAGPSRIEVQNLLCSTSVQDLVLLPAGTTQRDPADLLAGASVKAVLDHLRTLVDVVIVDTPAALAVTDSSILGALADGVLVVASAGKTTRALLDQTSRRLQSPSTNVLGSVLNRSTTVVNGAYGSYYEIAERKP
jgi:Mrp family chromosome partitioning ATPase/capsular polysaccharide biosynthesis protein